MSDSPLKNQSAKPVSFKRHPIRLTLKIVAWTIFGVLLFIVGMTMGVVAILTPDRLTPLVERIATQSLQNAEVKIDKVELTIVSTFPFVHAQIDRLAVLSTVTEHLSKEQLEGLPAYTDTVLTVRQFEGGINIMKLFSNQLDLADVTIEHPSANIVIIDEKNTNFDIIPPSEEKDEEPFDWKSLPGISLKRFTITDPGKVRFFNKNTGTSITATFTQVCLNGNKAPLYTLNFDGDIQTPSEFIEKFNLSNIKFGLNGTMHWSQEIPTKLRLEDFEFLVSVVGGLVNTDLDFSDGLKVDRFDVVMKPINVHKVISMVPPALAQEFNIPTVETIKTDASIYIDGSLKESWNVGSDTIPPLEVNLKVPPCSFTGYDAHTDAFAMNMAARINKPWALKDPLPDMTVDIEIPATHIKWQDLELQKFEADITATVPNGILNDAIVTINNLVIQGPATELEITGTGTHLMTDPYFDGVIDGTTDISKFPQKLLNSIDGTISGLVTTHIAVRGATSMIAPEHFHKLYVNGDIGLENFYWISGDTVNMVDLDKANLHFGTADKFEQAGKTRADSLLRLTLDINKAAIVHSDLAMNLTDFAIGLATQNKGRKPTKGEIVPIGGKLELGTFNLLKTNDSTVVKLRELKGSTVIKAYNNDIHTPQFLFNLDVKRLAAGDKETRLMISDAHTNFNARRVAKSPSAKRFTKIADSVHYAHPHLSPDSVAKIALEIHNRHRSKYPRVHEKYNAQESVDVIDWGASPLFKRLLSLWTFEGTLKSQRAGLFTPVLPLRNRLRNIDISFNNDSITMSNLQYKIGDSDFTINGIISNMRKAFTSGSGKQPLRVNFESISENIDINQLTDAIMIGSAYSLQDEKHKISLAHLDEDEEELERHIARLTENAPDSMMPILIPPNLDAQFSMRAANVRYSDFTLHNMRGNVLAYDGALNMQNLSAKSDVGDLRLSALYSGLHPDDLRFGFGLQLNNFNINRFLSLVPAIDSLMPIMRDLSGIISVDIAATSDVDKQMNLVLPTLDAAVQIRGDSLVLIDPETFRTVAKWLLFRDKQRNVIDHMNVQMTIKDNQVDVYPFIFDIDRYKLGIQGYNDFDLNFKYHIAVLKSPIPFKFGINVSGNPDKFKVRLGGAKFGEKQIREVSIVDTTRINLMNEINNVFKRGARNARLSRLKVENQSLAARINLDEDTLTREDSIRFIQEGLIDTPPGFFEPVQQVTPQKGKNKNKNKDNNGGKVKKSVVTPILTVPLVCTLENRRRRRKRKKTGL